MHHKKVILFQMGFIQGRRTADDIFPIGKYLRVKRGILFWCFIAFEKPFDSIKRALWFKMIIIYPCYIHPYFFLISL